MKEGEGGSFRGGVGKNTTKIREENITVVLKIGGFGDRADRSEQKRKWGS